MNSCNLCGREVDPKNWAGHNTALNGWRPVLRWSHSHIVYCHRRFWIFMHRNNRRERCALSYCSPHSYIRRTIIRGDEQIHFPLKDKCKGRRETPNTFKFFWSVRHASISTRSTTYLVSNIYSGHCLGNPWYPKDFDLTWVVSVLIWKVCRSDTLVWQKKKW